MLKRILKELECIRSFKIYKWQREVRNSKKIEALEDELMVVNVRLEWAETEIKRMKSNAV